MTDTEDAPRPGDFETPEEFISAHETFHDRRTPDEQELLDRTVRLASESMRAIELQLRRMRSAEPEDTEWPLRVLADFEFLIAALWRLRVVAQIAKQTNAGVSAALAEFDQRLPDLALMRHVAQHLDDYARDHPELRRQKKPGTSEPVGRRLLEVYSWSESEVRWLGGTIDVDEAQLAAASLYDVLRAARERTHELTV